MYKSLRVIIRKCRILCRHVSSAAPENDLSTGGVSRVMPVVVSKELLRSLVVS